MKITGEIANKVIKDGTTAGKNWKRCSYTIGNTTYSTFDTQYMEFYGGNVVNIEYEQEGSFFNIKHMELATQQATRQTESPEDIARKAGLMGTSVPSNAKKYIVTVEEIK